jgi:ketosteroid isomerase-like protein
MKRLTVLVLLTMAACQSLAQQAGSDEQLIRQILQVQENAWNRGDIPAFMEGYWKSDSLLFTGASGPTKGWQATLDNYRKRYDSPEKMGKLQFSLLQLTPLGNTHYMVVGKWHLSRSIGDAGGYFTLIFRKFGAAWRIIADHTS